MNTVKFTSLENIVKTTEQEERTRLKRGKSRSAFNIKVDTILEQRGVFNNSDIVVFPPESIPERATTGQIKRQMQDGPLASINACVFMATSRLLALKQTKPWTAKIPVDSEEDLSKAGRQFDKFLDKTIMERDYTKEIEINSFKLSERTIEYLVEKVRKGPIILRLVHKAFPFLSSPTINELFQWVLLESIDKIEGEEVADVKDPEEGLQYFIPIKTLLSRIDRTALHYQVIAWNPHSLSPLDAPSTRS